MCFADLRKSIERRSPASRKPWVAVSGHSSNVCVRPRDGLFGALRLTPRSRSGHYAMPSLLRVSPGRPSKLARATHASRPRRAFAAVVRRRTRRHERSMSDLAST